MAKHFFPSWRIVSIAFVCAMVLPALCPAQEDPSVGSPETREEAAGCSDLKVFPRLVSAIIVSCQRGDSVEVTLPLKPDAQGYARQKSVRGAYEFRECQLPQADQQEQAFENLMQLLPIAGFTVKYSYRPSTITARKENTWILLNVSGDFYNVSVVAVKEQPWTPIKDAEEISREMETRHRVAIYGIEFSPDNQAVKEEDSKILFEVLKYLKENPGLQSEVESHKMSTNGNAEGDQEITGKHAKAVVAWLEAHGIAAGRLQPKALGRSKPITENDTALEIQINERIELVKAAS